MNEFKSHTESDGRAYTVDDTPDTIKSLLSEKEIYRWNFQNHDFLVYPGVFSPKYFEDTEFYAMSVPQHLPRSKNIKFLEIGPGAGILPVLLAEQGIDVTGIDINRRAVMNSIANVARFGLANKVKILFGDIYSPLNPNEDKFDVIYWNLPFGYVEDRELSDIEKACYDNEYQATRRFFRDANQFLAPEGRIQYGFSTSYGNNDALNRILDECGLESSLIDLLETKVQGKPVNYELFEAVKVNHVF